MSSTAHRIIINTDAKNEADDQYAIVHALLSPTLDTRGIIPAHFGDRRSKTSMEDSRAEVDLLLRLLRMEGSVRVENGAAHELPDEQTPVPSPGSRLIIEESLNDGDRLFIAFLGPLTDMASALLEDPSIQNRDVTVVWIGGPPYGGVLPAHPMEFNLSNDIAGANVVFDSDVDIWQIPMNVYTKVAVGYAELEERVRPCGELGDYLVRQLIEFNETVDSRPMEFRSLGDSPAIGAVMNPYGATWREYPRPRFSLDGWMTEGRPDATIRVCESMDIRWLLEDMFAKLRRFAR